VNRPDLKLVDPETGELVEHVCPGCEERDVQIAGLHQTLDMQARKLGRLERQLADEDPASHHPQSKEIGELIDHWKAVTGHPRAKRSKDRYEVIKARLKDGYTLDDLRLAITGIGAFPYNRNGRREREGRPSERYDKLSIALGSGENVERFANLGARA
jgi:hypothetical protein